MDFQGVAEDLFGELVPVVVDLRELLQSRKSPSVRLFDYSDVLQPYDLGRKAVGPSHLASLADLIAADVLDLAELGAGLFECLAHDRVLRGFIRLDAAGRNAPASVLDVAEQHFSFSPREDKGGERS